MKISASIFSNPNKSPIEISQELEHFQIDYLHVDCCDDISVFDEIAKIRKVCRTPIDLHVITREPDRYYDLICQHNIELIAFQHEQLNESTNTAPESRRKETRLNATRNETN